MKSKPRRKILAEGRFVRLVKQGNWEWAERTNNSGAVAVAAVTADGGFVLTEQFRVPVSTRAIDLTAGLSGDEPDVKHEELASAARRELSEETGFQSDEFEYLTEGPTSPGLSNEIVTFFLARNARQVAAGGGHGGEDIQVHVVPLDGIDAWLEAKRQSGVLVDPKVYTGLYLARRSLAAKPTKRRHRRKAGGD